jgi:quercetin dioxygenase-like cupin family protein
MTKKGPTLILIGALSLLSSATLSQDQTHVLVTPDDIVWGPASDKLPPGARFALLTGDPSKEGELYVFRAELPDGYSVPPHWHPRDENVTVLKGVFMLGFGERMKRAGMHELTTGSYVTLPRGMPHFNLIKGETILQFHGIGSYDIIYVNPDDDPRAAASSERE